MSKVRRFLPIFVVGAIILVIVLITSLNLIPKEQVDNSDEYRIIGYTVNATIQEDNKVLISEVIETEFLIPSHGIFRQIPIYQQARFVEDGKEQTKRYEVEMELLSCPQLADFYTSDGNYVVQVGDAYRYADDYETYELTYVLDLGDDKITSFDQVYYNFIGNQWDTTISNINITISFEKAVENSSMTFYVGTDGGDLVFEEQIVDNTVTFSYNGTLEPYYGITGRTVLEEGFFTTEKQSITPDIIFLCLSVALLIVAVIIYYYKNNKNKIVEIVEFKAPKGITPSDAGYIVDKTVNKGDISSLIVYWANRGYLKIIEEDKEVKFQKLKDSDDSFKVYEKEIFDSLFGENETANLKDKNLKLATAVANAKDGIKFENERFFSPTVSKFKFLLIAIFSIILPVMYYFIAKKVAIDFYSIFICIVLGFVLFGACYLLKYAFDRKLTLSKPLFYLIVIAAALILLGIYVPSAYFLFESYSNPLMVTIFVPLILFWLVVVAIRLNGKIEGEKKEIGRVYGLRNFILHAEKDRLEVLVEENPSLFYEILPYAYVLGISKKWIKKFDEIEVQTPAWYNGTGSFADTHVSFAMITSMLIYNSLLLSSQSILKPTLNSSGKFGGFGGGFGGFGGGGASGGGLGGGGGGRW